MGLFDFLKPKNKGIAPSVFNTEQYQMEITAYAQVAFDEHYHDENEVKKLLMKEGLNEKQCHVVIDNVKRMIDERAKDFLHDMDSGGITQFKVIPSPEHKKGEVGKDQIDRYIAYGAFQMDRNELENALELFDKALELDDTATLAYANKGTLYTKMGDNAKALECYNKALEFEPNHIGILENKMQLLFEMMDGKDDTEFLTTVGTVLNVDPFHYDALSFIIQKHLQDGEIDQAFTRLKNLFQHHHSDQFVIQLLNHAFWHLKEKEQAMAEFDRLEVVLTDDAKYQLYYCKALHLKELGDFEEAIELFHQLNKQHLFSWNFYQIAIIKNLQGKEEECFENLKRTFEFEPGLKEDAKQFPQLENLRGNPTFIQLTS